MKYSMIILVYLFTQIPIFAQKELTHWFNGLQYKHIKDKFRDTFVIIPYEERNYEKNGPIVSAFSDKESGELLFTTTKDNVYDYKSQLFPNGENLSTQIAIIELVNL